MVPAPPGEYKNFKFFFRRELDPSLIFIITLLCVDYDSTCSGVIMQEG
jgi:hypothetical protein